MRCRRRVPVGGAVAAVVRRSRPRRHGRRRWCVASTVRSQHGVPPAGPFVVAVLWVASTTIPSPIGLASRSDNTRQIGSRRCRSMVSLTNSDGADTSAVRADDRQRSGQRQRGVLTAGEAAFELLHHVIPQRDRQFARVVGHPICLPFHRPSTRVIHTWDNPPGSPETRRMAPRWCDRRAGSGLPDAGTRASDPQCVAPSRGPGDRDRAPGTLTTFLRLPQGGGRMQEPSSACRARFGHPVGARGGQSMAERGVPPAWHRTSRSAAAGLPPGLPIRTLEACPHRLGCCMPS